MASYLVLIVHAGTTVAMTGIIWFVHVVHYPVMQSMSGGEPSRFDPGHWTRTMPLAVGMLIVETVTGVALVLWPPSGVGLVQSGPGLLLLAGIWGTTWFGCVPQHACLRRDYSPRAYALLMRANLARTLLWSLRSGLVAWMLWRAWAGAGGGR